MNTHPLVSVIIPCYNSEEFIEEAVQSALDQRYKNIEVIIIDDSSSDNSFKIINALAYRDKRVKPFRIEHTGLPAAVRNYGIDNAAGEFVAFLDSDDKWTKDKLTSQLKIFNDKPDAVFVYSMSMTFGDVNLFSPMYELLPLFCRAAKNKEGLLKIGNTIPLSSVMVRTNKLKSAGGFDKDPELKVEDYDLWLRLAEEGNFYFLPRVYTYYRVHANQFSADWKTKEDRLTYLKNKRGLKLREYRYYRKRGGVVLFIRNVVHFKAYLLARFLGFIDKII